MEFWWSRGAYATKQTIIASRRVATEAGLLDTPPFSRILPLIEKVADAIDTAEDVGAGILGGIGGAIVGFATGGPVGAVVGGYGGRDCRRLGARFHGSGRRRPVLRVHGRIGAESRQHLFPPFRRGHARQRPELPQGADQLSGMAVRGGAVERRDGLDELSLGRLSHLAESCVRPRSRSTRTSFRSRTTGRTGGPEMSCSRVSSRCAARPSPLTRPRRFRKHCSASGPTRGFRRISSMKRADPKAPAATTTRPAGSSGGVATDTSALFCALETTWTDNGPWQDNEIRVAGDTNVFITQIGCGARIRELRGVHGQGVAGAGAGSPGCTAAQSCGAATTFRSASASSFTTTRARATAASRCKTTSSRATGARSRGLNGSRIAMRSAATIARSSTTSCMARGRSAARSPTSSTTRRSGSSRRTWRCCPGRSTRGWTRMRPWAG